MMLIKETMATRLSTTFGSGGIRGSFKLTRGETAGSTRRLNHKPARSMGKEQMQGALYGDAAVSPKMNTMLYDGKRAT